MLIGTPVDFKRFYLDSVPWKGSVPSIYEKPKDSLDTDYPRNEGSIFPKKRSLDVSLGPYRETSVSKIPLHPPPKKNRFFFGLGRPIRNMLSIFQDDRSTTLSNRMGLF